MINVKDLTIETIQGRKLIDKLSLLLNQNDKIAIIGEEGNGKSTLLKAIYNPNLIADYCNVSGHINTNNASIGYLEQKLSQEWDDFTVFEYFLKANSFSEIDYDVYNQIVSIKNAFLKYGIKPEYIDNDMLIKNLSGGEKVKLQLAKLSVYDYDVYLLDEPTNDLDIETLEKLELFMLNTKKPLMFISHDEILLEKVANQILHIEQLMRKTKPKHNLVKCSYKEYVEKRNRAIAHQTQMAYSQRREKDKKEEILRQIKQKVENALVAAKKDPSSGRIIAKKMANIKAQERRNEEEELIEIPDPEEAIKLTIDTSVTVPRQKTVLKTSLDNLYAGDNILAHNIILNVTGPEKIAIIGNNGCGKSTLIRELVSELKVTPGIKVGYFSQNYAENLNYSLTAAEEISSVTSDFNPRNLLGTLNLTSDEMIYPISELSEGQKAKVLLLKIILEKNNVLVLDEPTRNLSPLSNPVLRKLLKAYNGAIITVSHDRKFISEICQKVYKLTPSGLQLTNFENFHSFDSEPFI